MEEYQGLSARSVIQRQSGAAGKSVQTGLPRAPARCATMESVVITRSNFWMTPAAFTKSAPKSLRGFAPGAGVRWLVPVTGSREAP